MLYSKAKLNHLLNLDDFEKAAKRYLPNVLFSFIAGGVETNSSLNQNRATFQKYSFIPRVMRDVSTVDIGTSLWDEHFCAPFGIAPMGLTALMAYQGDLVQAQAAQMASFPMIMSGSSLIPMEKVAAVGPNIWFQAYLPATMEETEALIERIRAAGFEKLVITADGSVTANRENNIRTGFSAPLKPSFRLLIDGVLHPRWTFGTLLKTFLHTGMPHVENNYAERGSPIFSRHILRDFSYRSHLNWAHFDAIRKKWSGKLIIKGILSVRDAQIAVEKGADGIIVSNHGGRQLDGAAAPLVVLPDIVRACPETPVMIDGGFRRGTDVVKALALGARFVFIGRPFNYAAAIGGTAGVLRAAELLSAEISRNIAMLGVTDIAELNSDFLVVNN